MEPFEDRVSLGRIFLDSAHLQRQVLGDATILSIKPNESKSFFFYYALPPYGACRLETITIAYINPLTGKGKTFAYSFIYEKVMQDN